MTQHSAGPDAASVAPWGLASIYPRWRAPFRRVVMIPERTAA